MAVVLLPDPIVVAVAWAKADPDIAAIVGAKISSELPKDHSFPWLRAISVAGGIHESGIPLGVFIVQWDAYDAGDSDVRMTPDYPGASLLARTLHAKAAETAFAGPQLLAGPNALVHSNRPISGPLKVSDEPTGWARFRVDTELVYRAA